MSITRSVAGTHHVGNEPPISTDPRAAWILGGTTEVCGWLPCPQPAPRNGEAHHRDAETCRHPLPPSDASGPGQLVREPPSMRELSERWSGVAQDAAPPLPLVLTASGAAYIVGELPRSVGRNVTLQRRTPPLDVDRQGREALVGVAPPLGHCPTRAVTGPHSLVHLLC